MEIRNLGASGLKITEIAYGNWLTHGSQVEEDAALACVRAALDAGITTFDTADVYANTKAETVLGKALAGRAPRGAGDLHQGLLARPAPARTTTTACPASTSWSRSTARCERLRTDYVDLYQAHRYDYETPLEETMEAFADVVHSGKALYIGVSEWRAEEIRGGPRAGPRAAHPARLQPAAVQHAVAGHRGRGRAHLRGARASARSSGRRSRRACSPASTCPGSRRRPAPAPPTSKGGADMIKRWLDDDLLDPGAAAPAARRRGRPVAWPSSRSPGCCRTPTSRRRSSARRGPSRSPRTSRPPA